MSKGALTVCLSVLMALTVSTSETFGSDENTDHSGLPAHYRAINLGSLGGTVGGATAVNERGDVVGYSELASGYTHPFLRRNGKMIDLGSLDPAVSYGVATDVNDRDEVVGDSAVPGGHAVHAFLWKDGHMTDLGSLSASTGSFATGINDRGEVTGFSYAADGGVHSFLWHDGTMSQLPGLGGGDGSFSSASAINDDGVVVGRADGASGPITPVLWYKGSVIDLSTRGLTGPDAFSTPQVVDINNRDELAGLYYFTAGQPSPALFVPTDR